MKSILMPSNSALTEEVLRQLGDDGPSRMILDSDGEVKKLIFTTPHIVANFGEYGDVVMVDNTFHTNSWRLRLLSMAVTNRMREVCETIDTSARGQRHATEAAVNQ